MPINHKRRSITLFMQTLLCSSALTTTYALADGIVPGTPGVTVSQPGAGAPVVNIAAPDARGLSHNAYSQFNVDQKGLVLNNATAISTTSLASKIPVNPNFSGAAASVILNEVTGAGRSNLGGYVEVGGQRADVIIANPYGITCDGCGFLNTSRLTLTTGQPQFDPTGALQGFRVSGGDILVQAKGADATAAETFSLISRSVMLAGQVNAKELDIVAGRNDWNYDSGAVTPLGAAGDAPGFAIDSSELGGMYADRITLRASEAGVGVRMLGDAASGAGDFSINAAGEIEIRSAVSSTAAVAVESSGKVTLAGASLTAGSDMQIKGGAGVALEGGALKASAGTLSLSGAWLTDNATASASSDANKRYASGDVEIDVTGAATINGTDWGAGKTLSVEAGSIAIGAAGATLYGKDVRLKAKSTDLSLGGASVLGRTSLDAAAAGEISLGAAGVAALSEAGNITIAASKLTNAGKVDAQAGSLDIALSSALDNASTGKLQASGAVSILDRAGDEAETIGNDGLISAGTTLSVKGGVLDNSGVMQAVDKTTLEGTQLKNSGRIVASTEAGMESTFTFGDLTNEAGGEIEAKGDLRISATGDVYNEGLLLSQSKLSLQADEATNKGKLVAGGDFDIALTKLTNTSEMQAAGGTIDVSGDVENSGTITLGVAATGSGELLGAKINNDGGVIRSFGSLVISANQEIFTQNGGKIITGGDLDLRRRGSGTISVLNDGGVIEAGGALDMRAASGSTAEKMSYTGSGGATIVAGTVNTLLSDFTLDGASSLTALEGLNLAAHNLTVTDAASKIVAAFSAPATATLTVNDSFYNAGMIAAIGTGANLFLDTVVVSNAATGGIGATGDLTFNSEDIKNDGAIFNGGDLLVGTSYFTNNQTGTVDVGGDAGFCSSSAVSCASGAGESSGFTNYNTINVAGDLTIRAAQFLNSVPGGDTRQWSETVFGSFVGPMSSLIDLSTFDGVALGNAASATAYSELRSLGASLGWWDSGDFSDDTEMDDTDYGFEHGWGEDNGKPAVKYYQIYIGGTPSHQASLIAGSTLTIADFEKAENLGSIISAPTVNITGEGSASQFINDNLALYNVSLNWHWKDVSSGGYHPEEFKRTAHYSLISAPLTAGVFADHLSITNTAVRNGTTGGAVASSGSSIGAVVGSGSSVSGGTLSGVSGGAPTIVPGASGTGAIVINNVTISFPTNPNGFFVPNLDPASRYAIVTNSIISSSGDIGSDLQAQLLGLEVSDLERRLGDAAYEQYLIQQQLTGQLGSNVIDAALSQSQQTKVLYEAGAAVAQAEGLVYGKPLTPEQQASLKTDIVWMVETEYQGQKVLAPVVYLSAATKESFDKGNAVIQANNADMMLTSLENNGGLISGRDMLSISSTGDITNTSGVIRGGDVSLASTEGSIINRTYSVDSGGAESASTHIGETTRIESTGNLKLAAAKDITNTGAQISAGGDADLAAGDDITFQSIQNRQADTEYDTDDGYDSRRTETITNVKSGLDVGGDMGAKAGRDITFSGTDAKVAGKATLDAERDINILSVQDSRSVTTKETDDNIVNRTTTTTTTTSSRNVASNIEFGELQSKSGRDTNIVGSNLTVSGDADMEAGRDVNILAGQNLDTKTVSETKVGLGVADALFGAQQTDIEEKSGRNVASNVKIGGNTKINAQEGAVTIQGSNLSGEGDGDIQGGQGVHVLDGNDFDSRVMTQQTFTVLGGSAEGSASANAQAEGSAYAGGHVAGGGAGASASASSGDGASAGASSSGNTDEEGKSASVGLSGSASANANATADTSLTLFQHSMREERDYSQRSVGSEVNFGGDLKVKTEKDLTIQGSNVHADGNVDVDAGSVNVLAGRNIEEHSVDTMSSGVGLFIHSANDASAGAQADLGAGASGANVSGDGSASLEGGGGAGFGVTGGTPEGGGTLSAKASLSSQNTADVMQNKQSSSSSRDVTHTAAGLSSGGDMNVKAKEDIRITGSDVASGGDMNLEAKNIISEAAIDEHSESTSDRVTGIGFFSDASGEASIGGGAQAGGGEVSGSAGASAGTEGDTSAGIQAHNEMQSSSSSSTRAKVSNITAGGNLNRTAEEKIVDVGTNIEVGKDFTQTAESFESRAAEDTDSVSASAYYDRAQVGYYAEAGAGSTADASAQGTAGNSSGATASAGGSMGASAGMRASLNHADQNDWSSSSTAVVGNIKVGGNMTSVTTGKTTLEGTQVQTGGDLTIGAGSLEVGAAENKTSSGTVGNTLTVEAQAGLDAEKLGTAYGHAGYEGSGEYSETTNETVANLSSGGDMKIVSQDDASFRGTGLSSGGDMTIAAKGDLDFDAAHDTSESYSHTQQAAASVSFAGKRGEGAAAEVGFHIDTNKSDQAKTGTIDSGGKLTIASNKDINFEGTDVTYGDGATIAAKGDVNMTAAHSTTEEYGGGISIGGGYMKGSSKPGPASTLKPAAGTTASSAAGSNSSTTGTSTSTGGSSSNTGTSTGTGGTGTTGSQSGTAAGTSGTGTSNNANATTGSGGTSGGTTATSTRPNKPNAIAQAQKDLSERSTVQAQFGIEAGVDFNMTQTDDAKAGSFTGKGPLTVSAGNDINFEGVDIDTTGKATLAAGRDVNLTTADSESVSAGLDLSLAGGKGRVGGVGTQVEDKTKFVSTEGGNSSNAAAGGANLNNLGATGGPAATGGTGAAGGTGSSATGTTGGAGTSATGGTGGGTGTAANTGTAAPKKLASNMGAQIAVGADYSSTEKAGSIKADSVEITAGRDATLLGTDIVSAFDTEITAGRDVKLGTADSVDVGGGIGISGSASSGGPDKGPEGGINSGNIHGGKTSDTVSIKSGTNTSISSGGATKMEGASIDADGKVEINAKGGIEKSDVASGGVAIGLTEAGLSLDVQKTDIDGKDGTVEKTGDDAKIANPLNGNALEDIAGTVVADASASLTPKPFETKVALPKMENGVKPLLKTANGKPVPSWVKFDTATGTITGTPPAGFEGSLDLIVVAPQKSGTPMEIPVSLNKPTGG